MAWLDNLLNHFALYPAHLFALLFVMALSKSTVLVSSVLPPASVMLLAGITVSQASMHPAQAWLAVVLGATAGSVLNYHIGGGDAQAECSQGLRRQPAFRLRMGGAVCRHRHRHQRLLSYKLPIPPSTSSSVPTV